MDDGSTDASLAIAKSFDDPRVVVLSDGRRRRLPARLNELVRRARSPFVARMDADDVSHPSRLAKQIEYLESSPACDVVGTWAGLVDDDGALLGILESPPLPAPKGVVLERGLLIHPSIMGRRMWFLERPYDEALTRAEDRDLWCRAVSDSTFAVLQEPLHVLRVSPHDARFLTDYLDAHRQNRQLIWRYGPDSVGRSRCLRMWSESLLKSVAMRFVVALQIASWLVARRGRPPMDVERSRIREAFEALSIQRE